MFLIFWRAFSSSAASDESVAALETAISSAHPLQLARAGSRSAAVLAAGLGLSGTPGSEAAVTREALGTIVRSVTAIAPDFFSETLTRARPMLQTLSKEDAIERVCKISRAMATRVRLLTHDVWASRPGTYTWLIDLHCAADPAIATWLQAEQDSTKASFNAAVESGDVGGDDDDDEYEDSDEDDGYAAESGEEDEDGEGSDDVDGAVQ